MKAVNENSIITEVMVVSDTEVDSGDLIRGWKGVAVETVSENGVEGTLIYFPGVCAKELIF